MNNPVIDFFTGLTLVNVIPHYLVGLLNVRFLGLYGYSSKGNIAYSWTSFIASLILFHINYGLGSILEHTWFLGGVFVVLAYLILGNFLIKMFKEKK